MSVLRITQQHIDNGLRNDSFYSPICLAFRDAGYTDVLACADRAVVKGANLGWMRSKYPQNLVHWLEAYNQGAAVEPAGFEMPAKTRLVSGARYNPEIAESVLLVQGRY